MNKSDIQNLIIPFLNSIDEGSLDAAEMFAFKSKNISDSSNQYLNLDYEFYNLNMSKNTVSTTLKTILNIFINNYINNDSKIFQPYNIHNSKSIIDYIDLIDLDFSINSIKDGTDPNLESNNYKVQYLLHQLDNNQRIAQSKQDYKNFKHSLLRLTNNRKSIIVINKVTPLYKPKGLMFLLDGEISSGQPDYKLIEKDIFKLPLLPHILIIENKCFLIQADVESIFGFEKYNKKIRDKALDKINRELPLTSSGYDLISTFSLKGRNYDKFSTFNEERYDKIKNNDPTIMTLLQQELKISLDASNNILISTEEEARKFILFLCNCILRDIENDNTLYMTEKSKPL